jgi:hypothetical protein
VPAGQETKPRAARKRATGWPRALLARVLAWGPLSADEKFIKKMYYLKKISYETQTMA